MKTAIAFEGAHQAHYAGIVRELALAGSACQQDRLTLHRARHEVQQRSRGLVEPLDVVEQHHERALRPRQLQ